MRVSVSMEIEWALEQVGDKQQVSEMPQGSAPSVSGLVDVLLARQNFRKNNLATVCVWYSLPGGKQKLEH